MRLLSLLFLISIFSKCVAPYPVIRLNPEEGKSDWLWGREYLRNRHVDIEVALAFEGTDKDHLFFVVEILNESSDTILIAPSQFFSTISQQHTGNTSSNSVTSSFTVFCIDPENELLTIDKTLSREEASYRNTLILQATADVAQVTTEVAFAKKGITEQDRQLQHERWENSGIQVAVDKEDFHQRSNYLLARKLSWEQDVLRKTNLRPGETIRGLVIFPTIKSQRSASKKTTVTLSLPISTAVFKYNFRQQIHHP